MKEVEGKKRKLKPNSWNFKRTKKRNIDLAIQATLLYTPLYCSLPNFIKKLAPLVRCSPRMQPFIPSLPSLTLCNRRINDGDDDGKWMRREKVNEQRLWRRGKRRVTALFMALFVVLGMRERRRRRRRPRGAQRTWLARACVNERAGSEIKRRESWEATWVGP